jgi:excinuclease UvrABC ATPase subunit
MVFTGVSGSGKTSPVLSTIAAESQRLINETYSARPVLLRREPVPLDPYSIIPAFGIDTKTPSGTFPARTSLRCLEVAEYSGTL